MEYKVTIWVHIFMLASDKVQATRKVIEEIFQEINLAANIEAPPAIRNGNVVSAINYLDTQWRSFAKQVGKVDPDGFAYLLQKKRPDDFRRWSDLRAKMGKPLILKETL